MSARPAIRLFEGDERLAHARDDLLATGRGLAYGDGVFETMRAVAGTVPWWPLHRERLARGAARLGIPVPVQQRLDTELAEWSTMHPDAVIKLILTRGSGGRGYASQPDAPPLWLLTASSLPAPPRAGGLVLRWCQTRLASQPALAGIKHCNRLEQVLARAEWQDTAIDDGLTRDHDGDVVCATAGNLLVFRDGRWWTPPVERCGVAGICRAWALEALPAAERRLNQAAVESADALVLCNAVRGILPVARLGDRVWSPHPAVLEAQRRLAAVHPAFPVLVDSVFVESVSVEDGP